MKRLTQAAVMLLCILLAASCQRTAIDEEQEESSGYKRNITLKVSYIEQIPFTATDYTSRSTDISQLCTHLFFAVYGTDNKRVIYKSQNATDKDFGKFSISLSQGTYNFVLLAYNTKDNPTSSTDPEKISFGNNGKMSDTFLWSEEITVDNNLERDVSMHRAVAMFRLVTTDNIPSNVAKMRFYYTGGSSAINALTGKGCNNSKQEEVIAVNSTGVPGTFEVYTFPKDDENLLKMTVSALDASGNTVASRTFEDVPITRNKITQYKGEFFSESGSDTGNFTFNLTTDDEWGIINQSY